MPDPQIRLFHQFSPETSKAESTGDSQPRPTPPVEQPGCSELEETRGATDPAELMRRRAEHELDRVAGTTAAKTVSVSLGTIVPLLIDAVENDRAWLADFADEAVRIDADLYDVLLAYQQLRGRAAA